MPNSETHIVANNEQQRYYPYSGRFFVNRHSFWNAGQDSYTQPPTQNEDMFALLSNVEPITRGILERRRGYTLFSNTSPVNPFQRSYSYRNDTQSIRDYIWNSTSQVLVTDEAGNIVVNNLFTPNVNARPPRMVLSRDYAYFGDGVAADYLKWNGNTSGTTTNWGINVGNIAAATFGPNNTGTGANVASGTAWTNPGNITGACDSAVATVTVNATGISQYLYGSNYGFAAGLSTQNIKGIQVAITYSATGANVGIGLIGLTINGTSITGGSKYLFKQGSLTTVVLGGPSDLWGNTTLTGTQVQASAFGILLSAFGTRGIGTTFNVDCINITVYVVPGVISVGSTGAGNITLLSGRTYFSAFQNSSTGHVSGISPPSLSTGPLSAKNVPLSSIPVSLDPQVDTVLLLATADGNDQTTLFLLAQLANGTTTYTDNTPDALTASVTSGPALLTNPVFQQTDSVGILHGVANNNPPPTADFPVKHKGRFFMAQGHNLYFSKNLDEVTTSTGTITSKWEESWPATNLIDLSEFAETIQGLMSDGETLWIGTERSIRRLIGDSPSNFQKPEIQFTEAGVLSQEVWRVAFYEGQPVGVMWMTPDFRVMSSDFNTYKDIGTPIQNVLNSINPAALSAAHACSVTQQAFDLYMLYIPTGSNTVADTVCVYNLRSQKWTVWQPTDLVTTSLFNINASGVPQWLFASSIGPLYFWDVTQRQDRNLNTPVTYPVTIQTSWLDFGDYNLKKFVNQIIPTTADNLALTVAVDAGSNEQDFTTPTVVVPATTVIPTLIPDDVFVPLAGGPGSSRAFRFTFVSPASTIQNILTAYSIESGVLFRF